MPKKKSSSRSYLSPKRLLTQKEYEEYQSQQQIPRRFELKQKIVAGKQNIKRFSAQQRYSQSRTGRVGSALTRGLQTARAGGFTSMLYQRQVPITSRNVQQDYPSAPRTLRGSSGGKVGRPRQTYDLRYRAYGGVYGYRKMLAAKLRERRLQLQAQSTISPQQQMVINRIQAQQNYQQLNPENKIIPDTYGQVPMNHIFQEADAAANIFP